MFMLLKDLGQFETEIKQFTNVNDASQTEKTYSRTDVNMVERLQGHSVHSEECLWR